MHVPSGFTFLLQPIVFAGLCNSDVNVMIDGTLIAPSDPSQWKCKDNCSQWITFHDLNNLSISGAGDDCISIGDGSAYLNISSITCGPGHGISVGSLGFNGANETVEHVYVSDVVFRGTENGVRIKTWQGGKGYATDIAFERITNFDSKRPIVIDQFYCDDHLTCTNQTSAVAISNVRYNGIQGTSQGEIAIKFACSETLPCTDIYMNGVNLSSDDTTNKTTSSCQNVQGTQHEVVPNVPCLTNK
ncbi:hypothetical protein Vadar_000252 [Vaccinium darrowii]|uniref:Uncharacterized protein n=1 Tax=Vaccinium darrowii TaxID=229202 RepID=A0ACB7XVR3_9ERIC|nr:hypothetical protein Vadar_000252 [Vaccinium darrowii]